MFTTGQNPRTLDSSDWEEITFGHVAEVLRLKFDGDLDVAFGSTTPDEAQTISLDEDESEYVFHAPLNEDRVWLRPTNSGPVDVRVIAYGGR